MLLTKQTIKKSLGLSSLGTFSIISSMQWESMITATEPVILCFIKRCITMKIHSPLADIKLTPEVKLTREIMLELKCKMTNCCEATLIIHTVQDLVDPQTKFWVLLSFADCCLSQTQHCLFSERPVVMRFLCLTMHHWERITPEFSGKCNGLILWLCCSARAKW